MRVSTRGRYALRLMLDLAMNNTGEPVRLKDVAKRQEISEKYLEQIISILNKAGFVKSVRGPAKTKAIYYQENKAEAGGVHRRHDPSADRRQPCPSRLRRRRHRLRPRRPVRHRSALEETERRHQRRRGQHHPGRPRGLADAEGE
mgnify:CR=1 FL=1